ncbi:MAG TPA: 3-phosphoserine/phosphohydroxythreonine transaminase [Thermoguttaceae bacterium]|nr:3-phosphoserine/phosphohydroxythreonine transaminase [Thermoguttaceae bacterium]
MEKRIFDFSPGPAVLPVSALEEAQRNLVTMPGAGISILEMSHRSPTFTAIIEKAEANLRKLLNIPQGYHVLFLQGGSHLQFAMIPMNLLHGSGKAADYIVTGSWSKKALPEAKKQGEAHVAWDGKPTNFNRVPKDSELKLNPDAAYAYLTSNETIEGVQFHAEPNVGNVPLMCDASSDFLHRPLPIDKYGLIYACAQKNLGPAGVTVVVVRDDLVQKSPADLPEMLSYKVMADNKSLYNTAPTFAIYMVQLVTDWLLDEMGGLDKVHALNKKKAKLLYDVIDESQGFYDGHAEPASRSLMNVTFRLPNPDLEKKFVDGAAQRDLHSLKGHRSVGGFRASIYNAMPIEGVERLADFMREFRKQNR